MIASFLALPLPEAVKSALTMQQFLLPLPARTDPAGFHLTLLYLGEQPDPVLEAAHDGFAALRVAPFEVALQNLGLFGGAKPRAAWAGVAPCEALARLQAKVERVAEVAGCGVGARRFVAHVTLGRFSPPQVAQAMRLERAVAETPFQTPVFRVAEMVLYRSTRTAKGSIYDVLARYPLVG